jgi:hypothetical protein
VEIGSYCGRSTAYLGTAAAELGVTVFAVDPHRGNPEMRPGEDCYHPDVWANENGSLTVLLDTVAELENVVPVVAEGSRFAETGVRPGFVFIDANHDYLNCLDDFLTWSALLVDDGIIALHDSTTAGPFQVRQQAIEAGWELLEQHASLAVLARG